MLQSRIQKLRELAHLNVSDGILLERTCNQTWLLGGRAHVGLSTTVGSASIVVNAQEVSLVVSNIEAKRIPVEELRYPYDRIVVYPWWSTEEKRKRLQTAFGKNLLTDGQCEPALRELRMQLDEAQFQQFRSLCADTAEAMEESCFRVKKNMMETEVAAVLAYECILREIDPIILLVGSDERLLRWRHTLPTRKRIDDYVMLVIGGRRNGQYCCMTRFVKFSPADPELSAKKEAVQKLQAMLFTQSQKGNAMSDIFGNLIKAYKVLGFPEEWKGHHQGGITGYNGREIKASISEPYRIRGREAFAWNPSVPGFKAEDIFFLEEEHPIVLTNTPRLPSSCVKWEGKSFLSADILIR